MDLLCLLFLSLSLWAWILIHIFPEGDKNVPDEWPVTACPCDAPLSLLSWKKYCKQFYLQDSNQVRFLWFYSLFLTATCCDILCLCLLPRVIFWVLLPHLLVLVLEFFIPQMDSWGLCPLLSPGLNTSEWSSSIMNPTAFQHTMFFLIIFYLN